MPLRHIAAVLLVVSLPAQAGFMTGTQLKKQLDEARSNSSFPSMTTAMGYVAGVYDGIEGKQACPVKEISARDAMQVVHTWLNTHRAQLEQPAYGLVVKALSEEFPCSQ